jgi:hypothetical protein
MFRKQKPKSELEIAEETLEEKRQALAELQAKAAATRADQAAAEAKAASDMANEPFTRLVAEAEAREASAASAKSYGRVATELSARIWRAEKEVNEHERALVVLQVAEAQAQIDEHELAAAQAMERAMSEMRDAEAVFAGVAEAARRHAVPPPKAALETQSLNVLSATLLKFARTYSRTRGEPPPITVLVNTSQGIRPAENERIYIESPFA